MSTVVGSVAIASSKVQEAAKSKNITRTGKEKEANKTKVKSKVSAEAQKKPFKIVIRKLPVRDFNKDDFRASVMRVMTQLGYPSPEVIDGASPDVDKEVVQIEHFIEGKLSRKRGPVSGAGFLYIRDEAIFRKFFLLCPSQIPFLEVDDINNQPVLEMAPNQRVLRITEKIDKLEGTFEEDADYKNLLLKLAQPEVKRQSAEVQYDNKVEAPAIDFKNIPMIKFLREKGEKKIAEKRFLRRTQVASGISGSSSSGKGGKGSRGSEKERGDRSGTAGGDRSSGKSSGSGLAPLKRTTMASTSSKQNENTDSGSTGSTGGGGGSSRGGKGNKHSNASASATGDSWLAKTPAAAVGVPVDADMQEAIRRSVVSFREEASSSSTATTGTVTATGANASASAGTGDSGDKTKLSRRERESFSYRRKNGLMANPADKKAGNTNTAPGNEGPSSASTAPVSAVTGGVSTKVTEVAVKSVVSGGGGSGSGSGGGKDVGGSEGKEGGGKDGSGGRGKGSGSRGKKAPKNPGSGSTSGPPEAAEGGGGAKGAASTSTSSQGGKEDGGRNRRGGKGDRKNDKGQGGQGQAQGQEPAPPKVMPTKIMKRADPNTPPPPPPV